MLKEQLMKKQLSDLYFLEMVDFALKILSKLTKVMIKNGQKKFLSQKMRNVLEPIQKQFCVFFHKWSILYSKCLEN